MMTGIRRWFAVAGVAMALAGCAGQVQQAQAPASAPLEGPAEKGEIAWGGDYQAGLAQAKEEGKPVMVYVFATWCGPCKLLSETVFSRADVAEASRQFVAIKIDGDESPKIRDALKVRGYPTVLFLTPEEEEITRSVGAVPYEKMLEAMAGARERFGGEAPSG